MKIVWDEPKRLANIDEQFFLSAVVRPVKLGRFAALGRLDRVVVVIFAPLGLEGVSIVSARPASRSERGLLT